MFRTNPNMSNFPSFLIILSWASSVMKVPVRPTPALQTTIPYSHQILVSRTIPAVHDNRSGVHWVGRRDFTDKLQQWSWVVRHSVIWPHSVVELFDNPLFLGIILLQGERPDSVLCQHQRVLKVDMNGANRLCPLHLIWPVLVALDLKREQQN